MFNINIFLFYYINFIFNNNLKILNININSILFNYISYILRFSIY